ncbi:MAG: biotin-dependent carboxyltransferase [Planctomycetes bacterium]|nr:biotin-dependent carboxyltransferase [Planctomycetota bacterium]
MGRLTVLAPGQWTTMQALARCGVARFGITPGGAADVLSHRVANALVGNADDAATIECTLVGPKLRFDSDVEIALCGADLGARVANVDVPRWRAVWLRRGAVLEFGMPIRGARAYLAIAGGIDVPAVLGNRSTDRVGRFGGLEGRELRAGDVLDVDSTPFPGVRDDVTMIASPRVAAWARELDLVSTPVLRVVPRAHEGVDAGRVAAFVSTEFVVDARSDRMGLRLAGPPLAGPRLDEQVSSPVVTGTVQLPPDGHPIVLLADHQTTGGYPVLGELASVDVPRAAQLRPKDRVRFAWISVEEAQSRWLRFETDLALLRAAVRA